jgi:hypothetical protein
MATPTVGSFYLLTGAATLLALWASTIGVRDGRQAVSG